MENYLQQVKKAKKGDTKAFAELYQQIYPDYQHASFCRLHQQRDGRAFTYE